MKEVLKELKTYVINAQCECGGDLIRAVGDFNKFFLPHPPRWLHKCNNCGKEEYLSDCYPKSTMRWEDAPEEKLKELKNEGRF